MTCADDKHKSDPWTNIEPIRYVRSYINCMSVVYFSLLLFVRIEQNVKIYNTHYIWYSSHDIPVCLWCYCQWCYHNDCVTPQTFSIKIVNKHIIPQIVIFRTKYCSLTYAIFFFKHRHLLITYSLRSWWEYTVLDLVTPGTYLHNTMDISW